MRQIDVLNLGLDRATVRARDFGARNTRPHALGNPLLVTDFNTKVSRISFSLLNFIGNLIKPDFDQSISRTRTFGRKLWMLFHPMPNR